MSSSYMKENSKMSPLTLATTTTTASTTTSSTTPNTNGLLLLDASKLRTDLSLAASSIRASQSCDASKQPLKIRFLIFVEDADGSRFNIFDSAKTTPPQQTSTTAKSTQQITIVNQTTTNACSASVTNSTSTTKSAAASPKLNNEMLTRMVFGSFPMVVSNRTAIKVHSLKNSNKTMISNVFVYYNTAATINSSSKMNKTHSRCSCTTPTRSLVKLASNSRRESLNQIKLINESLNHNTKPIDIIKLNQSSIRQTSMKPSPANSTAITPTRSNANAGNLQQVSTIEEVSTGKSETQHQHQQQSLSSSDVDSANLSLNQDMSQNMSPCSSVPTYYGSYSGIYKRLMRSMSNSLISSATTTNTTIQSNDFSSNCTQNGFSNLAHNESTSELDSEYEKLMRAKRKQSFSVASTSSFNASHYNNKENANNQDDLSLICEKCVENQQRYPKYKIGLAVLFCLPNASAAASSSPKTPTSSGPGSPQSSTSSNSPNQPQQHSNTKPKLTSNKNSFDPLVLFPSLPSLPSSPNHTNLVTTSETQTNKFNFTSQSTSQLAQQQQTNNEFYEFFFSHLPIIEYQIKELKEKTILNLPLYFSPTSSSNNGTSSTRSSFSSTSQSSMLNENFSCRTTTATTNGRSQFWHKMLSDFEYYEKNFYSLFQSPRLTHPAWLTLINNRKQQTNEHDSTTTSRTNKIAISKVKTSLGNQLKHTNSSTAFVCNNLINDFVYLNKIINPKSSVSETSTPNSKRFFNFRQAFNLANLALNLNEPKSALNSSFLSVLLSTVLKHHLSWVFTVLPSNELVNSQKLNSLRKQRANWTQILEKTNPYNPLWAQLGDLHGAVNHPLKLVRTVLVGKDKDLIERLLFLLSYFIRCSNSSYFDISAENFDFDKLPSRSSSGQVSSSSSPASSASSPNSTYNQKTDKLNSSPIKSSNHSSSKPLDFNLEDLNESDPLATDNTSNLSTCLHLDTSVPNVQSREVNVFDVSMDPISQLNAVLANTALIQANLDSHSTSSGRHNFTKSHRNHTSKKSYFKRNANDEYCMMSLSSSSSIASPSSCSISSSPLNSHTHHLKMNKFMTNMNKINDVHTVRKQRNLSSNSIGENCSAQELPLIGCKLKPNHVKSTRMQDNFGYSLLASHCDDFVFEFVLHGTSDKSFLNDLYERLIFSKFNSIIDCELHESVYIVVDVDELDVRVYSSESRIPTRERAIPLVDSLVQSVLDMIKLFQNSEFVLLHLEDKLQELYTKAITLNQLKSQSSQIDDASLINLMELNDSADLDFLNRILSAVYLPDFEMN